MIVSVFVYLSIVSTITYLGVAKCSSHGGGRTK